MVRPCRGAAWRRRANPFPIASLALCEAHQNGFRFKVNPGLGLVIKGSVQATNVEVYLWHLTSSLFFSDWRFDSVSIIVEGGRLHKQTVTASGTLANPSAATTANDETTTANHADRWETL